LKIKRPKRIINNHINMFLLIGFIFVFFGIDAFYHKTLLLSTHLNR